ncbi:TPA: hypothetical protein NJY08_004411 [Salmonella enterica subsp. enterica serovar Typhi str. AG3]|nr:hypothetical protein [Salmonella enterica subsp. enterica serovar Typhi str. AG3]
MKIDISIDGHEKTFTTTFINGLVYRKYVEISEQGILKDLTLEAREKIIELIIEAFNQQFTADQFWNGIDAREIDLVIIQFCNDLRTQTKREGKLNQLPEETKV